MIDRRIEKDFLGVKELPADVYYGIFTARSLENFQISNLRIHPYFIKNLALIKKAAAKANYKLGFLSDEKAIAIIKASEEVIQGNNLDQYPIDVFQAGAGTPWNMNMNEVLANLANEILGKAIGEYRPIHPNDDVNKMQSSNDVIPNAIRLTSLLLLKELSREIDQLIEIFEEKGEEFKKIRKSGRTHMRDAAPISVGQEFLAYMTAIKNSKQIIKNSCNNLHKIHIGGTAVGSGVNTHPDYPELILEILRKDTGYELVLASDFIEKTQFLTDFQVVMDALSVLASILIKINNDLMILSSGPATGINELSLPAVEPGSSIMPGKINPSILESVNMVCFQILGNRTAVEHATRSGHLELNVYTPLIAFNLFNSISWLTNALKMMRRKAINGLEVNEKVTNKYFRYSNALAILLAPVIGYEKASKLAIRAKRERTPIDELAVSEGLVTANEMSQLLEHSMKPNMEIVRRLKKEEEYDNKA